MDRPTRRRLLGSVAAGVTVLAGCADGGESGATTAADPTVTTDPSVEGPTVTASGEGEQSSGGETPAESSRTGSATTTTTTDLDLREANVTAVTVDPTEEGSYEFSVTLYHDDSGEDGYANWWQVESLDGDRLGRRELLHAHGTQEFTRSATVEVPDGDCVVVRGHDQTHGYGGQAMTVNVETGATRVVAQGSERRPVTTERCP
ncbi:hypothetical protein [Halomarina oriensis]|uniref:Uncharacterized protein n=1 Tax=Halomarina oriensis TaxID=671145 RepID=A0A6B0GSQ6_9EURY|nr:hypothetical protein [Halomarina oriensis]MWG36739.1 hypothetical protein [Halomarina oriensis]